MNLWVNKKGLFALFIVATFFYSCEDEENAIGLPVENQLDLNYVEYEVPVQMVWTDSVVSQNTGAIYAGKFDMGDAGIMTAEPFITFVPQAYDSTINIPTGATFNDFYLELDYVGGLMTEDESAETFQVYQLADTINEYVLHFIEDREDYGQLLGEKTFTFYPDSVELDRNQQDTIEYDYRERIELNTAYGQELFDKLRQIDSATFYNRRAFEAAFKGIAISPGDNNMALPAFSASNSRIIISYDYEVEGNPRTGSFQFRPSDKYYHNVTPNKDEMTFNGGTFSDITCCYQDYQPVGEYVYQVFGSGISLKLDLSAFKAFADTINTTLLNNAVLEIDDVESTSEGSNPPSGIAFYFTNEQGQRSSGEVSNIEIYRTLSSESPDEIRLDPLRLGSPSATGFNAEQDSYTANITLFLQHMIKNPETTPEYLLMEAADFSTFGNLRQLRRSSRNLGAIRIPKEAIKVKLYYSNLE